MWQAGFISDCIGSDCTGVDKASGIPLGKHFDAPGKLHLNCITKQRTKQKNKTIKTTVMLYFVQIEQM